MDRLHLFHDALARRPRRGRWVRALWIAGGGGGGGGGGRQTTPDAPPAGPPHPQLPLCTLGHGRPRSLSLSVSTVSTCRSTWTRYPSFPQLLLSTATDTARDPTFDLLHILQHCPNLQHLALVGSSLLASALQVAAYPFRLHTLVLDPPICLKFGCMAHLSLLRVLRIVGIPEDKLKSWRDWCGEVRSLQRLRTLELVVDGAAERRVVSIDRLSIDDAPAPSAALAAASQRGVSGEKHRETAFPSEVFANTASGTSSAAYGDNDVFYQQWTTDRADEIAASCLDF
jgi:hypothetical protein